jgi:hypothetical protein
MPRLLAVSRLAWRCSVDKYALHRLLSAEPELKREVELAAIGLPSVPRDGVELAWRDGRRSLAAEWLMLYREVEDERTRLG